MSYKRKRSDIYYEYPGAILATTSVTDIARADFDVVISNRAKEDRSDGTNDKRKTVMHWIHLLLNMI